MVWRDATDDAVERRGDMHRKSRQILALVAQRQPGGIDVSSGQRLDEGHGPAVPGWRGDDGERVL
jgi:hypothetical protein